MHAKRHHQVIHSPVLQPQDWLRFVWIDPFPRHVERLKLSEKDIRALELCIMSGPDLPPVIPGTGGIRKARFITPEAHKGKSGGYRVFYAYFPDFGIVTLHALIAKGEQGNLSKADRNALQQVTQRLQRILERGATR